MVVSSWCQYSQFERWKTSILQLYNLHKTNYHLKKKLNPLVTYLGILYIALALSK